ncbi:protein GVQW3 [Trichonephila clavipes]|nr:protein GVQW3 [Trichonephila clavipes]
MKEQNISLKFCFEPEKTSKETNAILVRVHEDQTLFMKNVYGWFAGFREGLGNVSDKPRSEKPVTSIRDKNIEKVRKLIPKDRRLTTRMMADELQSNREIFEKNVGGDI